MVCHKELFKWKLRNRFLRKIVIRGGLIYTMDISTGKQKVRKKWWITKEIFLCFLKVVT